MLTVGLTGGIGSGKSTVAVVWEKLGAAAADADLIAHQVMVEDEGIRAALRGRFGPEIFAADEALDRSKLAARVFDHPEELADLNAIVHPAVIDRVQKLLDEWKASRPAPLGVVTVPLLIEAGMVEMFDMVVVVVSNPEQQVERLAVKGLSDRESLARIQAQMRNSDRMSHADFVLLNKADLSLLKEQAAALFDKLTRTAARKKDQD